MKKPLYIPLILVSLAVLILGAVISLLDGSGHFLNGWLAYTALLGISALLIYAFWRLVNPEGKVTRLALISFFVRLSIGVALFLLLPKLGYANNPEHQAGYVYTDAYNRDRQAWDLAISHQPLLHAFSGQFTSDQYGGMLAGSALIYRTLSPDAHRPLLILILGAAFSSLGVLSLWKATRSWFDEQTAILAAWFFALYPESLLLSSSQMREAIVIPMSAVAFYGLTAVQERKKMGWVLLLLAALLIFPVQPLAGFVFFALLFGLWLLDPSSLPDLKQRRSLLILFLAACLLMVAMLLVSSILSNLPSVQGHGPLGSFLAWFQNNFTFQSYLTERASGMFQSLLNSIGEKWRWLIITVYGIAQPVLPAVVGDPGAAWIMRIIGVLRAAGWYALALFLVYGTLGSLRTRLEPRRLQLIFISLITWTWIILVALNAGADQWDNPRYRTILLVWQVILAAWAWGWARQRQDVWLWRWLAVELVFVGMFTEWYLGRYYPGIYHLDIKWMSALTLLVCGLILLGGWLWDKTHKKKAPIGDNGL